MEIDMGAVTVVLLRRDRQPDTVSAAIKPIINVIFLFIIQSINPHVFPSLFRHRNHRFGEGFADAA